jgi:hypothetical protein
MSWFSQPWVSYLAIAWFQLKVVWGAWLYRDLTGGDTATCFTMSEQWLSEGKVNLLWSPL